MKRKVRVKKPDDMKGEIVTFEGEKVFHPGARVWIYPVSKKDGTVTTILDFEELSDCEQKLLFDLSALEPNPVWTAGRAFVYNSTGLVEYFHSWKYYEGDYVIHSFAGNSYDSKLCKPLDYVCDVKYFKE